MPRITAIIALLFVAALLPAVEPADPGLSRWRAQVAELQRDPALVRHYLFDEGEGFQVANHAGDGRGALTLLSNDPYGYSREHRWWVWNSPRFQVFPSWTVGRWPGKPALSSGLAGECVVRSRFSGTEDGIFSLAAWIRPHGGAAAQAASVVAGIGDGYGSGLRLTYARGPGSAAGAMEFRLGTPTGPAVVVAGPVAPRIWHLVVCQWDGRQVRLSVDGAPSVVRPCAGPYVPVERSEAWARQFDFFDVGGLHLGGKGGAERHDIDELAILARPTDDGEIRRLWEAGRPAGTDEAQVAAFEALARRQAARDAIALEIPASTQGIFRAGERIPVTMRVPAAAGLSGALTGHWRLRDARNGVVGEASVALAVEPGQEAVGRAEVVVDRCGVYFLDLWLTDAAGTVVKRLREEYGIAITVPLPHPSQIPASSPLLAHYIGGKMHENRFLGFAVDRDVRGNLDWDARRPGEFRMGHKPYLDFIAEAGIRSMFCLYFYAPEGAELLPGRKYLTKDLGPWAEYCRQMVRHYRDRVAYWEILSEPNGSAGIPPEEYAEILKTAYAAIKAEDPSAVVIGVSGCPGFLNYHEKVFAVPGAAQAFDVLSIHNYVDHPIAARNQERTVRRVIEQVSRLRGGPVPVWNGESGFHPFARTAGRPTTEDEFLRRFPAARSTTGGPPILGADMPVLLERDAAAIQVQAILLDLGEGCEKYVMLSGVSHYTPVLNDCDGQPSEMAPAIAALQSVLIPSERVVSMPLSAAGDAAVVITQRGGRRIAALFSDERPTLSFQVGDRQVMRGMDLMGNPLEWPVAPGGVLSVAVGREPVYLFDVPEDFAERRYLRVDGAPAALPEDGALSGELVVVNPGGSPLRGSLRAIAPAPRSTLTLDRVAVEIPPAGEARVRFHLDGRRLGRRDYDLGFVLEDGGRQVARLSHRIRSEGVVRLVPEAPAGSRPGDGRWWAAIEPEVCEEEQQVVHGAPVLGAPWLPQWRGPRDQAFTLRTAWVHDQALLLRLEVRDDALLPAPAGQRGRSFLFDGAELFFDVRPAGERTAILTPGVDQVLVIPAVAGEGPAPCDRWFGSSGGKAPAVAVDCIGGRLPDGYWIEGAVRPAAGAAWRVRAGTQLAFDALVDDADREGEPRKSAMALHGVFANFNETGRWGRYQLVARPAP